MFNVHEHLRCKVNLIVVVLWVKAEACDSTHNLFLQSVLVVSWSVE